MVSERTLAKQRRRRQALLVINVLTTFLFTGAMLGLGPMQLMVSFLLSWNLCNAAVEV